VESGFITVLVKVKGFSLMPIYGDVVAIADNEVGGMRQLSPFSIATLNAVLEEYLSLRSSWDRVPPELTEETWDVLEALMADLFLEVNTNAMIGSIVAFASSTVPENMLPCDGATYDRVDYPELYAVLDSVYILDADTFIVPDMMDRVIVGVGNNYAVGDTGGEDAHTLITSEMPSHSHNDAGHVHSAEVSTPTLIAIGVGVPAPSAIPGVGSTGLGYASLDSTGGDVAHENRQPYHALLFGIIAK